MGANFFWNHLSAIHAALSDRLCFPSCILHSAFCAYSDTHAAFQENIPPVQQTCPVAIPSLIGGDTPSLGQNLPRICPKNLPFRTCVFCIQVPLYEVGRDLGRGLSRREKLPFSAHDSCIFLCVLGVCAKPPCGMAVRFAFTHSAIHAAPSHGWQPVRSTR